MSLLRDSVAVKKLKAWRRAEFALKQKFERIDNEELVMQEVEAILAGKAVLGLPAGTAFDIQIEHANPDPPNTSDAK